MYTMDEIKNKTIWLFRQPRTGGTWITTVMAKKLNKKIVYPFPLSNEDFLITEEQVNPNNILATHNFRHGLPKLKNFKNQIIIRTSRKNKIDMLISESLSDTMSEISKKKIRPNIWNKDMMDNYLNTLPSIKPYTIERAVLDKFINGQIFHNRLWNEYSSEYESEVIYYEDVVSSWTSSILPITLSMTNDTNEEYDTPFKLPYEKKELILNYDELDKILKDKFNN